MLLVEGLCKIGRKQLVEGETVSSEPFCDDDGKSLVFRAKRRSAGNKNGVIAVIGQPKCGVFTWCHDREPELSSEVSCQQHPAYATRRRRGACPPGITQSTRLACLSLPLTLGFAFSFACALCDAGELQSHLLSLHEVPWYADWSVSTAASEVTWHTLFDLRENKQFCGFILVSSQISIQIRWEYPFCFCSS